MLIDISIWIHGWVQKSFRVLLNRFLFHFNICCIFKNYPIENTKRRGGRRGGVEYCRLCLGGEAPVNSHFEKGKFFYTMYLGYGFVSSRNMSPVQRTSRLPCHPPEDCRREPNLKFWIINLSTTQRSTIMQPIHAMSCVRIGMTWLVLNLREGHLAFMVDKTCS